MAGALNQSPESWNECGQTSKEDCKPRPFDQEGTGFIYVKHQVMQPESGAFDLISPCHEYKSLVVAATLDRAKLQAKFAHEVLKFAVGCMNIRSNGTIHFGVVDSKENTDYTHGEIIGIPVQEKDIYVDALDYIEKCIPTDSEHVRQCVRPPRFIEVMDQKGTEKRYVVEVDIVPLLSIVRNKVYKVRLPNKSAKKVKMEKQQILRRVGANTESVNDEDLSEFYERVKDRDTQREEAERSMFLCMPESCQDLGRKLTMLMTSGKKLMEEDKWFILVTNKFKPDDLCNVDWLLNMNVFCVFDFDPDSKVSGLCKTYVQHHTANMHSLQTYKLSGDMSIKEFISKLYLFDQTSWIFCNGRSDFKGNENPCDELTWIRTKMTLLRESVSLICKQILPKGTFQVIFLLTSPVEKPLLHTFNVFFTDMEGHDDIICICEAGENFQKWKSFAEASCGTETLDNGSVVGMTMSHINATVLQIQPVQACTRKHLPVFVKGTCDLKTQVEEQLCSLEILTVNHCEETREDFINEEKKNIEQQFYHGGKVRWLNFWLAERGFVGEVIKRDAYQEVSNLLNDALKSNTGQSPVNIINIYHHPGSGGSTVARQVLWDNRRTIRCAVIKHSYSVAIVAEHAVKLREYEEKDAQRCLPTMLLIEDSDKEYLDDLKNELEVAFLNNKIVQNLTCFILLSCRRSHEPETKCKKSPLMNVSVTHKLSAQEKEKFSRKRKDLERKYDPNFILTFVLLSEEFNKEYVTLFVKHLLQGIDHKSVTTRLIHYVALLNTYVPDSFISQSHCEALLGLTFPLERFRQHKFAQSLSPQARLVFLHLRDEKTHINSVSIIHHFVAKEILHQLLGDQLTQSSLAMDLLHDKVLFEHRFGREIYLSFLRALFIRRARISKGDRYDSAFAPLIEHVCEKEKNLQEAIQLLEEAFQYFREDPFIAQTLAGLHYTYKMFEQAEHWAETAAKQQPYNSFILDTKGQVYKKWFQKKCNDLEEASIKKTPQNTADAVETALKAIECFQECEKAAVADMDNVNNSGFFSEVETECSLLQLILSVDVFANKLNGHSECMKYLADATTQHLELEHTKVTMLRQLQDLIKQSDQTIRSATISYYQLMHMQTVALPVHYQTLCESSKLYDPGQQYAAHVRDLQLPEQRNVQYSFENYCVSSSSQQGHRPRNDSFNTEQSSHTDGPAPSADTTAGDNREAEIQRKRRGHKSWGSTVSDDSVGGEGALESPSASTNDITKIPRTSSIGTVSSNEDADEKDGNDTSFEPQNINGMDADVVSARPFRNIGLSKAAQTHRLRKLRTPAKCRECDSYVYFQGAECEECFLACHKRCLETLAIQCGHKKLQGRLQLFGRDFSQVASCASDGIPFIITKCITEIERRALKMKGIYRVNGVKTRVEKLCQAFENGKELVELSQCSPHDISNVLKLYLRQLPEPIMPFRLYNSLMGLAKESLQVEAETPEGEASESNQAGARRPELVDQGPDTHPEALVLVDKLRELLKDLPKENVATLRYIVRHLRRIVELEEDNKMSPSNLGIVFGPSLMRPRPTGATISLSSLVDYPHQARIVEAFIVFYPYIFHSKTSQSRQMSRSSSTSIQQGSTANEKVERSADGDEEGSEEQSTPDSNKMEEGCESSLGSSEQLPDSDSELDENGQRSGHSHSAATLGSEASLDDDQASYRDSLDLSSQGVTPTDPEPEGGRDPDDTESAEPPMLPNTEPPEEEPGAEQDLSVSLAELNVNQSNNNFPSSPMVNLLGLPLAPLCERKLVLTRSRSSTPEFV